MATGQKYIDQTSISTISIKYIGQTLSITLWTDLCDRSQGIENAKDGGQRLDFENEKTRHGIRPYKA